MNYIKFLARLRSYYGTGQQTATFARSQWALLRQGIRDHRIADASIPAWDVAGGQW